MPPSYRAYPSETIGILGLLPQLAQRCLEHPVQLFHLVQVLGQNQAELIAAIAVAVTMPPIHCSYYLRYLPQVIVPCRVATGVVYLLKVIDIHIDNDRRRFNALQVPFSYWVRFNSMVSPSKRENLLHR